MMQPYPKRLIEVDLPIKRISAHSRREKSIRHGHISTLHIWWARRPLAACRAVICAALWPDPADPLCPQDFRDKASKVITDFANAAVTNKALGESCDQQTWNKWQALTKSGGLDSRKEAHWNVLRFALLDFIADFANWDNSTVEEYLETSRALTQAAHQSLGGAPGTRPLVVDPFAGGGSIPLEALRVGADAFASDLNPVPVLLNKVVLEYIPKYGQRLADEVRKGGEWIKREADKELTRFYPKDVDGAIPIAYLWARTIQCEGPGCGAEVPLIRFLWLAKRPNRSVALQLVPNPKAKRVDFQIIVKQRDGWVNQANPKIKIDNPELAGTVKRGSATCPCCGYTTPIARLREQLKAQRGGANGARLFCVVSGRAEEQGRFYRLPTDADLKAVQQASVELERRKAEDSHGLSLVPNEPICLNEIRRISVPLYGMEVWGDLFSQRQSLALVTFASLIQRLKVNVEDSEDGEFQRAVATCLALSISRLADFNSSISRWANHREGSAGTFGRQALPMLWDFAETCPLSNSTGAFTTSLELVSNILRKQNSGVAASDHTSAQRASAALHPMPDHSAHAYLTDPPYYDAIPYSHLSDFFYVWLKRSLGNQYPELFSERWAPKDEEIVVDRPHHLSTSNHDIAFYERQLTKAFSEGRRVVRPDGIGVIVFASKTTASWEAILKAVVDAGWIITGSWPIDTEMETRIAAAGQARLASSVHLVCRPREEPTNSTDLSESGDWRDILQELPRRIHEWMPRLAEEGVVGADAIFACLGPALEVFSRYSRVEKGSGERVDLREYLEHVWAAVAKEALAMVFKGADATGFEADARLTAMWLWTLKSPDTNGHIEDTEAEEDSDDESEAKKTKASGFRLEYDAARKIAQGLGADLEGLSHLVEIAGEHARLLPVSERTRHLFGKDEEEPARKINRKKKSDQLDMFAELTEAENAEVVWQEKTVKRIGGTTLDRVHQGMILFAAGRGEALKRFIVEDGVGRDGKFWRLAQALSALYPSDSDEKRWVDGVLARKKQFGF
jgi:adenine-specific DNA methylase